jgi:hypothetical protein
MMPVIQSDAKLAVTLEAQAWDAVLRIMAAAPVPYQTVAPLLQDIQGQCTRQQQSLSLVPRDDNPEAAE